MENIKSMVRNLNRYSNNENMYSDIIDEYEYNEISYSIKILDDVEIRDNKVNMNFNFCFYISL